MILKPSSDLGRPVPRNSGLGRFEARLADGGWVVFDTRQGSTVLDRTGQRFERLSENQARAKADDLNARENAKHTLG